MTGGRESFLLAEIHSLNDLHPMWNRRVGVYLRPVRGTFEVVGIERESDPPRRHHVRQGQLAVLPEDLELVVDAQHALRLRDDPLHFDHFDLPLDVPHERHDAVLHDDVKRRIVH